MTGQSQHVPAPITNRQHITCTCEFCLELYTENYQFYLENKSACGKFYCSFRCEQDAKEHWEDDASDRWENDEDIEESLK